MQQAIVPDDGAKPDCKPADKEQDRDHRDGALHLEV